MKTLANFNISKLSYVFCICLFLLCCNKDYVPDYANGTAKALRNSKKWKGYGSGFKNNQGIGVDLLFDVFNRDGARRQRLSFSKIPAEEGTYNVFKVSSQALDSIPGCSFLTTERDVVEDIYLVDETGVSTITVVEYNPTTALIRGTFNLKFHIDPNDTNRNPNNPDTIVFESGEFEVTVVD